MQSHVNLEHPKGKITAMDLKKINKGRVYQYLYQAGQASKQQIADALEMSLPTVTQHITALFEQRLINKQGVYKSTGGRRAQIIQCVYDSRIAIGVEILKEHIAIAAIDLFGNILKEDSMDVPFCNEDGYCRKLGGWINAFAASLPYEKERFLGVVLTIQGLISPDGETITYSEILKCAGMRRQDFQKYIDLPCWLVHDTEVALQAIVWYHRVYEDALVILLNRNIGGGLLLNRQVYRGKDFSSVIEHMALNEDGPLCYCGKHGCLETYCSADTLRRNAQMELPEFFARVHADDPQCVPIWEEFLRHLANAVNNIRMIADFKVILGGYLIQYLEPSDFNLLTEYVKKRCSFEASNFTIQASHLGPKAAKLGAALMLVDSFLKSIESEKFPQNAEIL